MQKAQQLAQSGTPTVERAVLPHIVAFLRASYPRLATGGRASAGHSRAMRSLFYSLATTGKFSEVQQAVGANGLHARIVDTALGIMQGPAARTREAEEAAAELCLLVPARLEHLIPVLPRMMHAAVRALNGSDRSVHVALRVLDVWVDSFNPEFIERSMAAVIRPMMAALWGHIRPPPHPFGTKVADMLGKMGGRSRRWLGEGASVEYKNIPEYGLRVILAFPPHTSFLVPLDRCVQLAWTTVENANNDLHRRKNSLRLLQICAGTLARLTLPADMLKDNPPPEPTTTASVGKAAVVAPAAGGAAPAEGAAPAPAEAAAAAAAVPPAAGPAAGPQAKAAPAEALPPSLSGDALGRLEALLFGGGKPPEIPKELFWPPELGVKTRKQHAAEKQMLETVLTAVMASAAVDAELEGAGAKAYAHATCRHFALLFAAGWAVTAVSRARPPSLFQLGSSSARRAAHLAPACVRRLLPLRRPPLACSSTAPAAASPPMWPPSSTSSRTSSWTPSSRACARPALRRAPRWWSA
jgi:transformation/transcription domain-associated protein